MLEITTDLPNFKYPPSHNVELRNPKSDLFCRYYIIFGHETNDCRHLKNVIEQMLQDGYLLDFVINVKKKNNKRKDDGETIKEVREPSQKDGP
ncbi:hypothetical protein ACS0TY_005502 [Phlomoides rotata]